MAKKTDTQRESAPKTIQYKREKKLNLALIHSQFQYMSETVEFSAWEDIDPATVNAGIALNQLQELVDEFIADKTAELIDYYRNIVNAQLVPLQAVRNAVEYVLSQQLAEGQDNARPINELIDEIIDVTNTYANAMTA